MPKTHFNRLTVFLSRIIKKNIFTHHPRTVGDTYLQHLRFAFFNGIFLIIGGIVCLIHSFFPFLFTNTASTVVNKINTRMDSKPARAK